MYKNKQYLDTWVICLLFGFWFFIIPGILGLIFLVMQIIENKKLMEKYGDVESINDKISELETSYQKQKDHLSHVFESDKDKLQTSKKSLQEDLNSLMIEKQALQNEISALANESI